MVGVKHRGDTCSVIIRIFALVAGFDCHRPAGLFGRELEELYPASDARPGRVFFEARELSDRSGRVSRVGFTLRRGEIVGLAGLVGSGRSETAELVSGADLSWASTTMPLRARERAKAAIRSSCIGFFIEITPLK